MAIKTNETIQRERGIYKVTVIGSIVNMGLLLFKFAAGIWGHSAAMIADAVHSLSDFITDIVVLVFVKISNRPIDEKHDYGYGKYETLATVIIGIVLFFVGLEILRNGVGTIWLFANGYAIEKPGAIALVAALLSILAKGLLARYTAIKGKEYHSQSVVANSWHQRSDALSSIGTAAGVGGAILLGDTGRILDPIAAVIVSLLIIRISVKLLVPCLGELLERSLPEETERRIEQALCAIPGVQQPHNLKTRKIGNNCAVDVHVRMAGDLTVDKSHEITKTIEWQIRNMLGQGTFVNIHVEPMP